MEEQLADLLRDEFLQQDRTRGERYFNADLVTNLYAENGRIYASVEGSYGVEYSVEVSRRGSRYLLSCECERFQSGFNCKHVWATILAADQESAGRGGKQGSSATPKWQRQLDRLHEESFGQSHFDAPRSQKDVRHWFAICLEDHADSHSLKIRLFQSQQKANGDWGKPQRRGARRNDISQFTDTAELEIVRLLEPDDEYSSASFGYSLQESLFSVTPALDSRTMEMLANTGRFVWSLESQSLKEAVPVGWDNGPAWSVAASVGRCQDDPEHYEVTLRLQRGTERREISEAVFAFSDGYVLFQTKLARLRQQDARWIRSWNTEGPIRIPENQIDEFLPWFATACDLVEVSFADDAKVAVAHGKPQPKVIVSENPYNATRLDVGMVMKYGDFEVEITDPEFAFWNDKNRTWLQRDLDREQECFQQLENSRFVDVAHRYEGPELQVHLRNLAKLVSQLSAAGWEVNALGKITRSASSFNIEVSSGTDWFDLDAKVDFDGVKASLPALLAAARKQQSFVTLDDGSHGVLPEEWLQRYGRLAEVGTADGDTVRFAKSQALLLDALLYERESTSFDLEFTNYVDKLSNFAGIKSVDPPNEFQGELRPYQRDSLGWFEFLREFGFGGCLADDMGLGKTVQVLAMLQGLRTGKAKKKGDCRPSIAIVPKSLVFNWIDEAARFTPDLKVLNYTGLGRKKLLEQLDSDTLLITTYGTLIRDVEKLKDIAFEYAILDEAQAIKNRASQSAKACRLLNSNHRLAMTGTPIENHLGELWSLFDFLNPGMLGDTTAFKGLTSAQEGNSDSLESLRKALAPFILRRTKQQVLDDLPQKVEQTLYCELKPKQSKLYAELRDHYRAHLGKKVDEVGINRSKIHVLEALLRLRQAACDPRLIDDNQRAEGAKIALLLDQLEEVIGEGHKALVFSQFTSFLKLVRNEVEKRKWTYEYLDGKTRKRGERVKRFQEDSDCRLFLISLKAGGHGLNLTAADYVYILDPWWNPAVEAQAIDRAHRIGQTQRVNAYRIICRDTVEAKILELQQSKRELADAIITANESLIASLSVDDLQMLFS